MGKKTKSKLRQKQNEDKTTLEQNDYDVPDRRTDLNINADVNSKKTKSKLRQNQNDEKTTPKQYDYDVPDRRTGLNAWKELKVINGSRDWRFVAIDVPLDELKEMKRERISKLIYPLRTILDDSIGCATWFAARGRGWRVVEEGVMGTSLEEKMNGMRVEGVNGTRVEEEMNRARVEEGRMNGMRVEEERMNGTRVEEGMNRMRVEEE